jgi:adenine-specific DNA glycosylase
MTPTDRRDLARELLDHYDRRVAGDVKRLAARFGMRKPDLLSMVWVWSRSVDPQVTSAWEPSTSRSFAALATIARTRCLPTDPQCTACPLVRWCATAQEGHGG